MITSPSKEVEKFNVCVSFAGMQNGAASKEKNNQ